MKIETSAFGVQEIDPDTLISFPDGLPGFEGNTQFKLFHHEGDDIVHYLQSLDDPGLTFSVVNPADLNIFYQFTLSDEETEKLQLQQQGMVALLLIAYKSSDLGASDVMIEPEVGANIKGPLVVNLAERLGIQKILTGAERLVTIKAD